MFDGTNPIMTMISFNYDFKTHKLCSFIMHMCFCCVLVYLFVCDCFLVI